MKKFFSQQFLKPLALLLVLVLTLMPMTAFAADDAYGFDNVTSLKKTKTVEGTNTTMNPILSVVVPLRLDFVLDPFGLDRSVTWQTGKVDMFAMNYMRTNVRVDVDLVASGAGLVFETDEEKLDKTLKGAATNAIVFGVVGATKATLKPLDISSGSVGDSTYYINLGDTKDGILWGKSVVLATGTDYDPFNDHELATSTNDVVFPTSAVFSKTAFEYDETDLRKFIPKTEGGATAGTKISFALEHATGGNMAENPELPQTTLAADDKGVAAFMFYANLNTQAPWNDDLIKVTGKYTLLPYSDDEFEVYGRPGGKTIGLNVLPETNNEPAPKFTGTASLSKTTDSAGYTIPFNADGGTITRAGANAVVWTAGTDYTIVGNTIRLASSRIALLPVTNTMTLRIWVDDVEYTANIAVLA